MVAHQLPEACQEKLFSNQLKYMSNTPPNAPGLSSDPETKAWIDAGCPLALPTEAEPLPEPPIEPPIEPPLPESTEPLPTSN